MQALTLCDTKITSARATDGQFKGQFSGAMEENVSSGSKGVPSTHLTCSVRINIDVGQRRRAPDVESPPL